MRVGLSLHQIKSSHKNDFKSNLYTKKLDSLGDVLVKNYFMVGLSFTNNDVIFSCYPERLEKLEYILDAKEHINFKFLK